MFQGYGRARKLIELPSVVVVGMRSEESNFRPAVQSLLVNAQTIGHLLLVQHPHREDIRIRSITTKLY
jgi:hypothetical protein